MKKDVLKEILETHNSTKRAAEGMISIHKDLDGITSALSLNRMLEDNPASRLYKELDNHRDLMKAVHGPLDDLSRLGLSKLNDEMLSVTRSARALEDIFVIPKASQLDSLFKQLEISQISSAFQSFRQQEETIKNAMKAMHTPWLNSTDLFRSVTGFSELQNIGSMIKGFSAFDDKMAEALRTDLGDWRDPIIWPEEIFENPVARSSFYLDLGFNPTLTDFPASAFQEGLSIAGLSDVSETDNQETSFDDDGLVRTKQAFERLQHFEIALRRFIEKQMISTFGQSWIKQKIPGEMKASWEDKKEKARAAGEPERPLIEYADFTDYQKIIERKDNWQNVFGAVFKRPALIQESLQRLYPIRICTMHARIITQDDELYLCAETRRILKAIGFEE